MLLSTQAVQEFYAASSRKLGMPRREWDATAAERLFIGRTLGGLPGRADDADAGTSHMTCNPLWRGTYSFALKIPVAALDPVGPYCAGISTAVKAQNTACAR